MRYAIGGFGGLLALAVSAWAVPSALESLPGGITMVRDDGGLWDGHQSLSITHQNRAGYQARKSLDISALHESVWTAVKEVRVSAFFAVRDYSWHDLPAKNGLDEAIEVVVNGTVNTFPTNCGAPVYQEGASPGLDWYDFPLPRAQFVRGVNEVIFRKAASARNDDYLYLGIDHAQERGNSAVDFGDGQGWRQDTLTIPGGTGEYMVRLYLVTQDSLVAEAAWEPGRTPKRTDPAGVLVFAGSRDGQAVDAGLQLAPGQSARLEWRPEALDLRQPVVAVVEGAGPVVLAWLDAQGTTKAAAAPAAPCTITLAAGSAFRPAGLLVSAGDTPLTLTKLVLRGTVACRPPPAAPIDMRPEIAPPAARPPERPPTCVVGLEEIALQNATLRARFTTTDKRLRLVSLYNEWGAAEMVRQPAAVDLFLVEVGEKRAAGSRDFVLEQAVPVDGGFAATLFQPEMGLRARLQAGIGAEGLRLGLELENAGLAACDFKLAFPHLAGLALSGKPADDSYYFPWGGGIFSDRPAAIRRGYGEHEALYQLMDLYSPSQGAGLYLRLDDAEGWHKILALRKEVPGQPCVSGDARHVRTRPEYVWKRSLPAVAGIGMTCEYLRRTREPGKSFAPAVAVLAAHAGDWRTAMAAYAAWAHRVWTWRPYPSRLKSVHTMTAHGWGHDLLFKDGAYRTDFVKPMADCVEIMSWWDWSPLGPLGAPLDQPEKVLSAAQIKEWEPYLVKDPVTGQTMWNNQPGDYRGYNERFGGLPAFRRAVAAWKVQGALVTLYTDPFRLDEFSCQTGRSYGKAWCVVGSDGKPSLGYEVTNPCHDLPEVRAWVATTMKRVLAETGADGIRLDEYGHMGWACFNPDHKHTYAEPGVSQWNKAVAETSRAVRQAMDEIDSTTVLTTEHPGYDYLMTALDGCITYDYTVQATPLRPLEVNLQRFYFPECKVYELDHRGADNQDRKKFWNGVASFGRILPKPFYTIYAENEDAYASRDCEALVPTLVPRLYANRFRAGAKTIYHLYNAVGHTSAGPALALDLKPGQHAVDLLTGGAARLLPGPGGQAVELWLERDHVACIAVLPERLRAGPVAGRRLTVQLQGDPAGCTLVVAAADGTMLDSLSARAGENRVNLAALAADATPACVKLLRDGTLEDLCPLPP
jgi:hypothetical protein